ncbi:MAG: long-chain fatty acid--CoA ligase, partial [Firmicutes bacterium]|nr:long-chain fatty acid--CoA ligase [Bacillota bacterium]
ILPDEEAIKEKLKLDAEGSPELKPEWIRNVLWNEIEKINAELPYYKKIKKLIIRKEPFIKNTSQKIIRFAKENQE